MLEDAIKKLRFNQRKLEREAINLLQGEIEYLNTEEQLYQKGVDARGRKLTPGYTNRTKVIKARKGQPTNRVTLRDTGELHGSFKVTANDRDITVEMTKVVDGEDIAKKLRDKYQTMYEGLSPESIGKLAEKMKPILIDLIKDELQSGS